MKMDFLLYTIAINIGIYGGLGYLLGMLLRSRFPKIRPLLCSFACLAVVFLLPLVLCGIAGWTQARSNGPFILPEKNVSSFEYHHTTDNVSVGADLYLLGRLRDEVFDGKDVFCWESYHDFVAVELIVFNDTDSSIEITPLDLDLKYDGQRIGAEVVGCKSAQGHLRDFHQVLSDTGGTYSGSWEVICCLPLCFPLSVGLAPRDWVWVQNWIDTISENEFEFGQINPSQTRHGFVYFEVGRTNVQRSDFLSPSGWGFEVAIHDGLEEATQFSFEFEK